ncbi:MAG: membrane protein insertase YidC [Anaerolineaceae bacterium]|nr:membrane protein insertase YidC [Anaerolineaceae bacterium]
MWDAIVIRPFINVLLLIYQLVGNFGIAIILFTLLIRLITYPLNASQIKSSTAMTELQKDKRYLDIQEKYKGDKEKLAQEQMKLYKEVGYNPMSSCLPTLLQFPIIIGLYQAIIRAMASTPFDMLNLTRHVYKGFLSIENLIPLNNHFLWMNLGQPERLQLGFINFGIPVLAILVVVTSYMQSKLMQPASSGQPGDQTAMMSNMMTIYMPFLMGYLALTLASGLALYFFVSNVLSIVQYGIMGKLNWDNLLPKKRPAGPAGSRTVNAKAAAPKKAAPKPAAPKSKPAGSASTKTNPAKTTTTKAKPKKIEPPQLKSGSKEDNEP